ncbi:MAG TPA: oxygenase MpaB family protein [Polyangiaceae bacterium]|nr:oxygenase MpaB family protein [Polyangiaceae bacterium]
MTPASPLTDARLDELRRVGDPEVDAIVRDYVTRTGEGVGRLLGRLFGAPELPLEHPLVAACWAAFPAVAIDEPARVERGQRLFDLYGPEILLTLGSCALPLAYAAGNGVQVVARARRLKDDPIRRLCDTAQMVINVMQPGELAENGVGWYSARKVRLIHALIRLHVQTDRELAPWRDEWGTPINQEDLAGTLLTFSVGVLTGLRRMGAHVSSADAEAYMCAWRAVGRIVGVAEDLLPPNEELGLALAYRIGKRQVRPTEEGRELSNTLLAAVDSLFPVRGYATSLSHFFLTDSPFGEDVARVLGIPEPNWTRYLVKLRAAQKRVVFDWLEVVPGAKTRRSYVARHFAQRALRLKHPDGRGPFAVPPRLQRLWGVSA